MGTAKGDLFLVILLLVGLGVAWYAAGGPQHALSRSGPFLTMRTVMSPENAYVVPRVSFRPGVSSTSASSNPGAITTFTNYLGTFSETPSPYAQYVKLERSGANGAYKDEYLTLRITAKAPQKITITGWRIESTATSIGTTLPQASTLPFLGAVNGAEPVALSAGSVVYIVTGRSPMGTSFRTNTCTGYFEQFQDFVPRLKLQCPSSLDEADRVMVNTDYTDDCEDVVRTVNRCNMMINAVPQRAGVQCQNFIQGTLTYNGCVAAHKTDPKFYANEWYLYLNRDQELWKNRSERIRLLDETGKVVAVVSY